MNLKNKQKNKIPDGWEIEKLGEVGNAYIGLTYSPRDVSGSGTLVFRSSNVQNGKIDYSDNVFVDVEDIPEKNIVKEGDILICARNGSKRLIGKNALITKDEEGNAFGAFMSIYRTKQYKYFFQLFQSPLYKKEIERDLGPTINQVTTGNLLKFKFAIPPLSEQKRIVGVLEVWDEGTQKLERKIEIKEDIKKGLMQQLLTSKKRLLGFSGEWEEERLGDVSDVYQPRTISKTEMSETGKYKVFGANGVIGYYNEFNHKESEVAITCRGATCGTINFTEPKAWITGNAMVVSPIDNNLLNKHFLFYYLSFINLDNIITGMAQPQITGKDLKPFKIKLPKIKEQKAIADVLTTADEEIEMLRKKLEILKDQKKFLLNDLITGQIRV